LGSLADADGLQPCRYGHRGIPGRSSTVGDSEMAWTHRPGKVLGSAISHCSGRSRASTRGGAETAGEAESLRPRLFATTSFSRFRTRYVAKGRECLAPIARTAQLFDDTMCPRSQRTHFPASPLFGVIQIESLRLFPVGSNVFLLSPWRFASLRANCTVVEAVSVLHSTPHIQIRFACVPGRQLEQDGLLTLERYKTPVEGQLLHLNDSLFAEGAIVFDQLKSRGVNYIAPSGQSLRVEFSGMPTLEFGRNQARASSASNLGKATPLRWSSRESFQKRKQ
jgi:hypothetical protein